MTRIGLYTATENELGSVQRAADRLDGIDLVVRSESDLDEQADVADFVDACEDAAAVVLWLHGGEDSMPGYEYAVDRLREAGVPLIVKATGDAFALEDSSVAGSDRGLVADYLDRGGTINLEHCCRFLAREYGGVDTDYDAPTELPTEGVYHPDYPGVGYEQLIDTFDPDAPTVAVWFYESHWTHENTRYVDAQVRALESQGANALPVFCNPAADEAGQENAEWVTDNWLIEDGEPIVDAVLSSFMFSLSMDERGRAASDEGQSAEDVFLDRLGVPVLQTITTMRSRSRYESSDTGVMGFELALSVALPEFDGNVITHPISGKERMDDTAGIGSAPKQHFPIDDRVDHAARLAVNWARLRYLDNAEKTVAVVLHNYPPSDDGIGTAFGLDSPESTINLLAELDSRGYDLDDSVPDSGQTLIDTLTSQLTLDNRWVDPEDVRERSVDVVSTDQYAEWFEAADERFQDNIVEEWGEPPSRPFAIPGAEFGNVLVTVQPPRG
ncbi:MAG: cobaltochelatase subunit CobN, partial [Halohasta sp.]